MKLSIIIPVFNEAATIKEIVKKVISAEIGVEKEIIVVDGASTDGTKEALQKELENGKFKVIFESKREGKGAAVHKALKEATGQYVIIQDGDLELDPSEIASLIGPVLTGEAYVVYGSRFLAGRINTPVIGFLGNKFLTNTANFLFQSRLTDIETCYKLLPLALIKSLVLRCKDFGFDTEITAKLLKRNVKITELPVTYSPRTKNQGKKLHLSTGFKALIILMKEKFTL